MKNILAENLLRFGVKNLSQSNVSNLHKTNLQEIAPGGSGISAAGQAQMDKMIADTQALAKGAIGITFTDGTSQPMKVGSASVRAVEPENWKLNGAIQLVMNTNFGGTAKSIRIGLLSDASGAVKIVGPGGRLLNLDAIGIKSALEYWLGSAYQKMLDRSTAANPSPYKQLITVLTDIANKYKSTGLAAPTRESKIYEIAPAGASISPAAQAQIDKMISATSSVITNFLSKNKITFEGPGEPLTVTSGVLSSQKDSADLVLKLDTSFANDIFFYLQAADSGQDLQLQLGGKRVVPITQGNVYSALLWSLGQNVKQYIDKYVNGMRKQKELADANQPNPLDQLVNLLLAINTKWKSGNMATRESKIYEVAPAGSTGTFDQAAMDQKVAASNAIARKYITSALKLDLKGGPAISVKDATIYGRDQSSQGGIGLNVKFNIKGESGTDFSIDFPIYSPDGVKPAGYYGGDVTKGKALFDTQFPKMISKYFATSGPNYDACKQGIWNGIVAVADAYTKTGVATKG